MNKMIWIVIAAATIVILSLPQTNFESFTTPLYAGNIESDPVSTYETPWLHVNLETKYTWFSQTSLAKAWVTESKNSEKRMNVGKLCIKLDAHQLIEKCVEDTSYIEVKDVRKRVATKKKTAVMTAWAEEPAIEATTVSLEP